MMRGVGGVRKSEHQICLAKGLWLGLRLLFQSFKGVQEKKKSSQWHFHQDNAPGNNYILFRDYLTKMGIETVPYPPLSPDLAPCDIWLFPKLRVSRYKTIGEMKEAVTKITDTLTQDDFHGAFQKLVKRYNKGIAAGGDYFEGD